MSLRELKNVLRNKLSFDDYKDVLFNKQILKHDMKRLSSNHHQIEMLSCNKVSLSCYDDKRFILDDGINTLAYGFTPAESGSLS